MPETASQSKRILKYLQDGNSITPLEALDLFSCMRLGARIFDLKNQGYVITSEMVKEDGKRFARYRLATHSERIANA